MSKYIEFQEVPFKGKTKRYLIISKSDETPLGKIQWYSAWRQYVFMSGFPTIWNKDCLITVQEFLQQLMDERM